MMHHTKKEKMYQNFKFLFTFRAVRPAGLGFGRGFRSEENKVCFFFEIWRENMRTLIINLGVSFAAAFAVPG